MPPPAADLIAPRQGLAYLDVQPIALTYSQSPSSRNSRLNYVLEMFDWTNV